MILRIKRANIYCIHIPIYYGIRAATNWIRDNKYKLIYKGRVCYVNDNYYKFQQKSYDNGKPLLVYCDNGVGISWSATN